MSHLRSTLILTITLQLCIVGAALGQAGRVFDSLSMKSEILGGYRNYALYLPPDYETSSRSYPVLYLLHGKTDDQTAWIQYGEVHQIADKAIREGRSTPMIIVMPDADTGQVGYFNSIDGQWRYEDFFFDEFIPFIEKTYRIRADRKYRAVAGLSMGGGGSFVYALHRPDMFSAAAPLSASFKENREIFRQYYKIAPEIKGEVFENYFQRNNVLALIDSLAAEDMNTVRWYIDCGDDDFLFDVNSLAHIKLRRKEVRHEYRVRDGGHAWSYWRTALPDVLEFVSQGFHK
jgi:enterochelin esterase-like enzyme